MKFSKEYLRDTIYACWLGKNIGGTIGTPYEGKRELQDISGFNSKPGRPLPNDDLDLQLVWLRCMDEQGPRNVNSKTLGEYWLSYVKPHWNEYGVGKANMRGGILPPLSGEVFNEHWKNSNGAWIRTEIWAALYPGQVEKAIKYAFEDASVDHGFAEGSYAAIFVAAMESAAYVIKDIRVLIDIGLSKIPADCRVAKAVRLAVEYFDSGRDWKDARLALIEQSADIGWFQAPANVAYCILGLLYGGCDFKKSVIIAVDCGDDTDCTGATTGALLGILHGMAGIPEDWRGYIGDEIVTVCLLGGHGAFPDSCTQLTECVMNLLPVTSHTDIQSFIRGGNEVEFGEENDFTGVTAESMMGTAFVDSLARISPRSFTINGIFCDVSVVFDAQPIMTVGGKVTGRIVVTPHTLPEARQIRLKWYLPEGWKHTGRNIMFMATMGSYDPNLKTDATNSEVTFELEAEGNIDSVNLILLDVTAPDRPTHVTVPITILG